MYPPHPHPHPPRPVRRWWQKPVLIIAALVLLPPIGIVMAWLSGWGLAKKTTATVLSLVWFFAIGLSEPEQPAKDAESAQEPTAAESSAAVQPTASPSPGNVPSLVGKSLAEAAASARDAGWNSVSHDASDGDAAQWNDSSWRVCFQTPADAAGSRPALDFGVVHSEAPCPVRDGDPIPWPTMPGVTGMPFREASRALDPIGFGEIEPRSAYTDVTLPGAVDDWRVCFQDPGAGDDVAFPANATAHLKLTAPSTACPRTEGTELHRDPDPRPRPRTRGPAASEDDSGSSGGSAGSGSSGGGSSSGGSSGSGSSGGSAGSGSPGGGSSGGSQRGVQYGRFCSPVGALATTADGRPAKCFMGRDGRARWGYAS